MSSSCGNEEGTTRSGVETRDRRIQFLNSREHVNESDSQAHVDSVEDDEHHHPAAEDDQEHAHFTYRSFILNKP